MGRRGEECPVPGAQTDKRFKREASTLTNVSEKQDEDHKVSTGSGEMEVKVTLTRKFWSSDGECQSLTGVGIGTGGQQVQPVTTNESS